MITAKNYTSYFENAVLAGRRTNLTPAVIIAILQDVAAEAIAQKETLLQANQKDLNRMDKSDPKYDRLKLTAERIKSIADDIVAVSKLNSPLGEILSRDVRPNGLQISKIRVPLGVVGVIYEARPNVTFDVFSLCFKTGNTCILKGGSDADFSNRAIIAVIHDVLKKYDIDKNIATLLPAEREATEALLNARDYVDVLIPRGSQQLINFVRNNSKVPVIETGAGIVHIYFDKSGHADKGAEIIFNAKTRRVSVCNALDCLIINSSRLNNLPKLIEKLAESNVQVFADEQAYEAIAGSYPSHLLNHAESEHFGTEFLDYKMAVKTVNNLDEAFDHIALYSSKHSEAIISEDETHIERFLNEVDAAAVYANTSTAFTDGAQFGLGAEIGISTQKLHARGPMGLAELTSYKWVVKGDGQVRNS